MAPGGGENVQPRIQARSDQLGHGACGDSGSTVAGLALCTERYRAAYVLASASRPPQALGLALGSKR